METGRQDKRLVQEYSRETWRSDQSRSPGGGEKWSHSGYVWNIKATGFTKRLDVGVRETEGTKVSPRFLA